MGGSIHRLLCLVDDGCHGDYGDQDADDVEGDVDAQDHNVVDESHGAKAASFLHLPLLVVVCSL